MSTTGLAKMDLRAIARGAPLVTEVEAEAAARNCGFDLESLRRVVGKREVGKYLARELYGVILADAHMDRDVLQELQNEMMVMVKKEGGKPDEKIEAGKVVTKIMEAKVELATMQLKAVEIGGHEKRGRSRDDVGPPIDVESTRPSERGNTDRIAQPLEPS